MERRQFDFHGGKVDQGALAQLFRATVDAAIAAEEIKAARRGQIFGALAGAISQQGQQRWGSREGEKERSAELERQKQGQEFQRGENLLARQQRASEFSVEREENARRFAAQQEQQRRLAQQSILGGLAETGVREQGLDATALMGIFAEELGAGPAPTGPRGPGIPPGGPGGYMIEPPQQEGYQGLQLETRQGPAGRFSNVPRVPPPKTWEQLKYELTEEQKQRVAGTTLELSRLMATGDKNVVVDEDSTLADALGLGGLDEYELEQAVLNAYPDLAPKATLAGEEGDRTALDAKIKFLKEKRRVAVPNGPGITGMNWQSAGNDKTAIVGALSEAFGQDFAANPDKLPMTREQRRTYAAQELLSQYPEYVNRFRPVSMQLQGDLGQMLGRQAEAGSLARGAAGELRPMAWSEQAIDQLGIDPQRIPRSLRDAAQIPDGWPIAPDPDGRLVFQPLEDGTQPTAQMQADLDRLMDDPATAGMLDAFSAGGPVKQSPSKLAPAAEARKATKKEKPSKKAEASVSEEAPTSEAPSKGRAFDALEEYRKSIGQAQKKPKPAGPRIPRSISLVGESDALLRLLAGGPVR